MNQLTKAEEQVMHILWELGQGTVQDVREKFENPKPARTTVATVLSILENKNIITHSTQGRINVYIPSVTKDTYSKAQLFSVMKNYFNNSFASMASFFAKEKNLTLEELDQLIESTKEELRKESQQK